VRLEIDYQKVQSTLWESMETPLNIVEVHIMEPGERGCIVEKSCNKLEEQFESVA